MAGAWPTTVALTASRHTGEYANTVVGATVAVGALGCILAPPVMGGLFQVVNPAIAMAMTSIPLLVGGALALRAPKDFGAAAEMPVARTKVQKGV